MRAQWLLAFLASCSLVTAVPDDSVRGDGAGSVGASSQGAGPAGGGVAGGSDPSGGGSSSTTSVMTGGGGIGGSGGGPIVEFDPPVLFTEFSANIEAIVERNGNIGVYIPEQSPLFCYFTETADFYACLNFTEPSAAVVLDSDGNAYTSSSQTPRVDRWNLDGTTESQVQPSAIVGSLYVDGTNLLAVAPSPGQAVTRTPVALMGPIEPLLTPPAGVAPRALAADLLYYYVAFEPVNVGAPGGMQVYSRSSQAPLSLFMLPDVKAMATRADNIQTDVFLRSVSSESEATTFRVLGGDPPIQVCDSAFGSVDRVRGLAVDADAAYMMVNGPGVSFNLHRFSDAGGECQPIASGIGTPGPIAAGQDAVFYADGPKLYRVLKQN